MPCVVPTCKSTEGTFKLFPRHYILAERWQEAIQIGSGLQMQIEEERNLEQCEICEWHFAVEDQKSGSNENRYLEPALFINGNDEYVEISSCRMCLRFYPSSNMISKHGTLGNNDITFCVYDTLNICFQDYDFLELICEECLAKVEILNSIQHFFAKAEVEFNELVTVGQTSAQEVHSTVKLEHPPVEAFIEEERADTTPEPDDFLVSSDEWVPDASDSDAKKSSPRRKRVVKRVDRARNTDKTAIKHRKRNKVKVETVRPGALKEVACRKCYICVTVLSDANELLAHLTEKHATKTDYRCEECKQDFHQVNSYNRHLGRHEGTERPHKCNHCALRFCSVLQMKVHEQKLHGIEHNVKEHSEPMKINICETCGKTFKFKSKLTTHIKTAHEKTDVPVCNICQKTFTAKSSLERHMLLHSQEKPHNCTQCDATFRRMLDLKHHVNMIHEGKNPHVCAECNEQFKNYQALYQHRQNVHLKKPPAAYKIVPYHLICQLCKQPHRKSEELMDHIKNEHPDEEYPYAKCPECPRTFLSKQHLSHHKEIHTDKYACTICGQRNATIQRLQNHVDNKHSDVRKYDCPICITKSYKTVSALKRHIMFHEKGKRFECEFCKKTFMRKDQMIIHRRIHTGEKPFQCPVCLKRFGDDATFSKHKKRCQSPMVRKVEEEEDSEMLEDDF